jgi:RNA recognition motif-containing protein
MSSLDLSESSESDNFSDGGLFDSEKTTVMIRNIPCRYNRDQMIEELETLDLPFNFLYLTSGRRGVGNLGIGFVNFVRPEDAATFVRDYQGYSWVNRPSETKFAALSYAETQGFEALVEFYAKRPNTTYHRKNKYPFIDYSK